MRGHWISDFAPTHVSSSWSPDHSIRAFSLLVQNWFMEHFNAPKHLILFFPPCSFKYLCSLVSVWVPTLLKHSACLHWVSATLWLTCRQFLTPKYLLNELRLNWGWNKSALSPNTCRCRCKCCYSLSLNKAGRPCEHNSPGVPINRSCFKHWCISRVERNLFPLRVILQTLEVNFCNHVSYMLHSIIPILQLMKMFWCFLNFNDVSGFLGQQSKTPNYSNAVRKWSSFESVLPMSPDLRSHTWSKEGRHTIIRRLTCSRDLCKVMPY